MPASLKLLLVGDVMLGRLVNEHLRDRPPAHSWGDTLPLFERADWRACNLECVIADHGTPWERTPKTFHFRSDAKNIAVLQAARIDAVSLANNHVLDFNHRGMIEMLRLLDGAHIGHSGAGLNLEEAARPFISMVRGTKVGLLAFTDNEPAWAAGQDHAGVFHVPVQNPDERAAILLDAVRAARAQADVLVVSAHWGGNWGFKPPGSHRNLARQLVRAGEDVVFGHSAHVCRGVEIFEGAAVIYSAGDFIDDYALDAIERNDRSWAFEIHTRDHRVHSVHLHPVVIGEFQARLAAPEEARPMVEVMRELCDALGTTLAVPDTPDRPVIEVR